MPLRTKSLLGLALVLTGLLVSGCASSSAPAAPPISANHDRELLEGYGLLYKLVSDDSQVNGILIIKSAAAPVKSLVDKIAKTCKDAKSQLDDFARSDSLLHYDVRDLPAVEEESRTAEAGKEQGQLIGSSGKTFESRLLVSQVQAMSYASDLAKSLATHESDAGRKEFLNSLSGQCSDLSTEAMDLLEGK
jgi:hypothetical protein